MWPNLDGLSVLSISNDFRYLDCGFYVQEDPKVQTGTVCAASFDELPFGAVSIDRVLAQGNWDLKEIYRILKPQGKAIFIAPRTPKSHLSDGKTYKLNAIKAELAAKKLIPTRIFSVGGIALIAPDIWIIEVQKHVFGKTPPRRGFKVGIPRIFMPQTAKA